MKYFGIVCVYLFEGPIIKDQWFLHFTFNSRYAGEEDISKYDEDHWAAFWSSQKENMEGYKKSRYSSPFAWNYIKRVEEVDTTNLHLGKWMKCSPYYYDGKWQSKPK